MTYTIPAPSLFKTTYSLSIRIWHWLFFLTITATLVTVLFASTLFTTKKNVSMVQEQVQQKGGTVSPEQARAVAHEYSDKLWIVHTWIGYGLSFLLLVRIIMEAVYSSEKKLSGKIRQALRLQTQSQLQKKDRQHYIWVKYGYVLFYGLFFVMAATGLGLAFEDVPFFKAIHRTISKIHGFTQYLIYLYILFHIVGVVMVDQRQYRGMVSAMINGGGEEQ